MITVFQMSDFRLSSASIEWGLAGFVTIYFLTFVAEFRHVRIGMPVIHTSKASSGFSAQNGDVPLEVRSEKM